MAKIECHSCDVCGRVENKVDSWYKGYIRAGVTIGPFEETSVASDADLCSDSCAVKYVQEWMSRSQKAAVESNSGE